MVETKKNARGMKRLSSLRLFSVHFPSKLVKIGLISDLLKIIFECVSSTTHSYKDQDKNY